MFIRVVISNQLKCSPTGSKPPMLYGLPKIHKPDVPLRPIVSCIGSPTYGLSKHIASLLSPLEGKSDYYVKNSEHFINAIDDITLEQDDVLVSYDVRSLFTNVPVDEAIEVIFGMLVDDESLLDRTTLDARRIADLLELCLKSTYFGYQGMFYEQLEGAAMGSPVSAVVANLYMEHFENMALRSSPVQPKLWKRYVDDICCVLKNGEEDSLLAHYKQFERLHQIHYGA